MLAWYALIAGILIGSIASFAVMYWYYEMRHECLPHGPEECAQAFKEPAIARRFR